jgi:hypothetical protein
MDTSTDHKLVAPPPPEPAGLDEERRAYVEALVRARCPELDEDEVESAAAGRGSSGDGEATVPMSILTKILEVVEGLDARIDNLARWIDVRGSA